MRAISRSMRTLSLVVLASGCVTPLASAGGGRPLVQVGTGEVRSLERSASNDLSCPVDDLETRPVSDRVWEVTGCDTTAAYAFVDRANGPRRWVPVDPIGARASNQLACPVEGLLEQRVGPEQRRVSGCGQSAEYQLVCTSRACHWTEIVEGGDVVHVQR